MTQLAVLIVRAVAWLVPGDTRSEWRREWLAELHAQPGAMRAWLFACGAPAHALWLQKEQWRLDMVMSDLKYGWRQLRNRPGFALAAMLTLAIGIGATTSIFSVVYGVLLKPLPYREPDRLVQLWETNPNFNWTEANIAPGNMISWRERNHSFEDMAWYFGSDDRGAGTTTVSLGNAGEPQRVELMSVSLNFFSVLGTSPAMGRSFVAGEDVAGRNRVLVLSHKFWRTQLNADPSVINRNITLNGREYLVAGVMPESFAFDNAPTDAWVPLVLDLAQSREVRRPHFLRVVARLKPGVDVTSARADIVAIAKDLERQYPETNTQMSAGLGPLVDWFVGPAREPLLAFLGAVGLVLLIACVNVTNLFLTRTTERSAEMHLRTALGASRLRLVRQLVAEAGIVAIGGALAGVAFTAVALKLFVKFAPEGLPRLGDVGINATVLLFAIGVTVVTTMLVGVVPAWQASSVDLRTGIGAGTRLISTGGRATRRVLVAAEVAVAVVLLVGALLTLRSFTSLVSMPPGFPVDGLVSARISLPGIRYGKDYQSAEFYEKLVEQLRQTPGITGAGATIKLPLEGSPYTSQMYLESRPEVHATEVRHKTITTGYLETLRVPLMKGRHITRADTTNGQLPIVVNQTFAQKYFAGVDPVGQRVTFDKPSGDKTRWRTILGVVGDEVQDALGVPAEPEVYQPELQDDEGAMAVLVRSTLPPDQALATLRRVIRDLDSQLAVYEARSMSDGVWRSVARERLALALAAVFALSALVLSAIGIFGVAAHSVVARTREIGVRMAFGASSGSVVTLLCRQELRSVVAGLVVGGVAAFFAARLVASLLFHVPPADPWSFAGSGFVLALTGVIAVLVPARRALRMDPVQALRRD